MFENRHRIVRLIENYMSWALTLLGFFTSYLCSERNAVQDRRNIGGGADFGRSHWPYALQLGGRLCPPHYHSHPPDFQTFLRHCKKCKKRQYNCQRKSADRDVTLELNVAYWSEERKKKSAISPRSLHERTLKVPIFGHNIHWRTMYFSIAIFY